MNNNKLHFSDLSTKAKNSLTDYYWFVVGGKKIYPEITFADLEPIDLTKLSKLRNVGILTRKEVEQFCKENAIEYRHYKKPIDNRFKNKKHRELV
ncbi:hypothetical protein ACTS9T_03745 [Empedobacter falsenii]